ncbi:MAG: sugar ABC transporter ATP-binding protein [Canibacter sp.]
MVDAPALELNNVVKSFGSNKVLKGVSMQLPPGSVTGLLGANGAGKSTLIKILSGVYSRQDGDILVDGESVDIQVPTDATKFGIQTVHQRIDDSIVPGLTVAENLAYEEIVNGKIGRFQGLRNIKKRAREVAETLQLGWSDSILSQDVYYLGIADAQMLLLARALSHRPRVLILDEPTSTLSKTEAERLFDLVRKLRDDGVAILYVSHRLSEISQLADHLVVLRDGTIHNKQSKPFDMSEAVGSMLGHKVAEQSEMFEEARGTDVCLEVTEERLLFDSNPISVSFRAGEVTGIIGLIGAGKTELAKKIFGADRLTTGSMRLEGKPYAPRHPKDAVGHGVFLVPEDRASDSMLPGWSIGGTSTLPFLSRHSSAGVISLKEERRVGADIIDEYNVVAVSPDQSMDALSGGNQQKVVVGRWQREKPKVMLLDEPYRGVDLGARREISQKARDQSQQDAAVIVFVSDVDELREVADRIIVFVDGEVRLDAYTSEVDNNTIIQAMSEVQ